MRLDDAKLARLVEELADAVIVADAEGTIVYWNTAAERVFGWSAELRAASGKAAGNE